MYDNNNDQTTLGSRIAALRKGAGLTQEQLAEQLGVTFQAVSKWENDISCPDVLLLPTLAGVFGISLDSLFGLEKAAAPSACDAPACDPQPQREEFTEEDIVSPSAPVRTLSRLPWQDDDSLYAVVYQGHTLLKAQQVVDCAAHLQNLRLVLQGDVGDVDSAFDVALYGQVNGDLNARGNITCADVNGDVNVEGSITCAGVCGDVNAEGPVNCTSVSGDVNAEGPVTCGDVSGDVNAEGGVVCTSVGGDVNADGGVQCGGVGGDVNSDDSVWCAAVSGDVNAGGDVHFCVDRSAGAPPIDREFAQPDPQSDASGLADKTGKKKKSFQWRIRF